MPMPISTGPLSTVSALSVLHILYMDINWNIVVAVAVVFPIRDTRRIRRHRFQHAEMLLFRMNSRYSMHVLAHCAIDFIQYVSIFEFWNHEKRHSAHVLHVH